VLHVNATAYGGGVAELLATHVPLLRNVGLEAEWQVIHGSDEFFAVTKAVHNGLQGADIEWSPHMQQVYLERVLDNALALEGEYDFVVMHDPQPAAMLSFLRERFKGTSTKWIWRCHIDLTAANPAVWEFYRPFVEMHDASVWTMPEFVPASLDMHNVVRWRETNQDAYRAREGIGISYVAAVIKAVTETLRQHPTLNSQFAEDRIIPRFHLDGIPAGQKVFVFKIDPGSDERLGLLTTGGCPDPPRRSCAVPRHFDFSFSIRALRSLMRSCRRPPSTIAGSPLPGRSVSSRASSSHQVRTRQLFSTRMSIPNPCWCNC